MVSEVGRAIADGRFTRDEVIKIYEAKNLLTSVLRGHNVNIVDRPNLVIAGGVFASMLHNEAPKDIDIYVLNEDYRLHNEMLDGSFGANKLFAGHSTRPLASYLQNPNIISVTNSKDFHWDFKHKTHIQLMLTKYKTREDMIADFDYKHCCVSVSCDKGNLLYISKEVHDTIKTKTLVPNKDDIFDWRTNKFVGRGWKVLTPPTPATPQIQNIVVKPSLNNLMSAWKAACDQTTNVSLSQLEVSRPGLLWGEWVTELDDWNESLDEMLTKPRR